MKRLSRKNIQTRTYKITSDISNLDELEKVLNCIEFLGNIGASRTISLWIDGDGNARFNIERTDKKQDLNKEEINIDKDEIDFNID